MIKVTNATVKDVLKKTRRKKWNKNKGDTGQTKEKRDQKCDTKIRLKEGSQKRVKNQATKNGDQKIRKKGYKKGPKNDKKDHKNATKRSGNKTMKKATENAKKMQKLDLKKGNQKRD